MFAISSNSAALAKYSATLRKAGPPDGKTRHSRRKLSKVCHSQLQSGDYENNEDFVGSLLNLGTDQGAVIHTGISGNKRLSARRS